MPSYVQAKMENTGELFLHCGSKVVAGRNSNEQNGAGENASLVVGYHWDISPNTASDIENVSSHFIITLPAYSPLVASVFNAVNQKDVVQELVLNDVDRSSTGGINKILATYTASNGHITDVSFDKSDVEHITISFKFEKIFFDDKTANTSGSIITTNGG
ncbi:hypothetical protein IBE48_09510 [Francisella philomiragia]|uniref:Uncharacterized protein n=1 Tax=Francisella philomiragia TaxID=28110 RepID=A0AAW3DE57_9GAMM|nr:hypothetical protein [Francisella philomiragia]KFJ44119.1 hypothetical protein DR78_1961 [Francisella philomiragia]MBK2255690.1 hypothetical protein [Francisella philomiragia]MBK2273999.1 hypothetical protein [Francisella philomiragia]MBK2277840.1 hypothetical protein [Francisella philomiragia]MBK2281786.1 hypothetical protein [Francisella philomiragia]